MAQDLRIGCCGFPIGLARYAGEFRVAEVQQTFYQPPLAKTLGKWRAEVPEDFEFALKAWQLITHESSSPTYRRLREKLSEKQKRETGAFRLNLTVMAAWQRTLEAARILRSRVILFQCPARFGPSPENKSNLSAFFHEVPRQARPGGEAVKMTFVWEPRGEWELEEVREICEELGLVHGVDPFAQKPATQGLGYFRLHGRGGYRYRYTDADLSKLRETALQRRYCYVLFNNIAMLEDARRFVKLASASGKPLIGTPD
jgi:uncharacterized protein YecE (DUF72 family)